MWNLSGKSIFRLLSCIIVFVIISMIFLQSFVINPKKIEILQAKPLLGFRKEVPSWSPFTISLDALQDSVDSRYPRTMPSIKGMTNHLNFSYIISQKSLCFRQRERPSVIIYVHSTPTHFNYRSIIRNTWGKPDLLSYFNIVLFYAMGKSIDEAVNIDILLENENFQDIMQEDFVDSYRNLSYKAIASLRWINRFCPSVKFVLKVDDDMIVNVFSLIRYLNKILLRREQNSRVFYCNVWEGMPVLRDTASTWYISNETFGEEYFPNYCSGSAFIFPREIVSDLYNATFHSLFIWVDDVYLTGFLARAANISHKQIDKYYSLYADRKEDEDYLPYRDLIFIHLAGTEYNDKRIAFWNKIQRIERITMGLV